MPHPGRTAVNFHVKTEIKGKLDGLADYHREHDRDYMSMTRILEQLITKEYKRLKLE